MNTDQTATLIDRLREMVQVHARPPVIGSDNRLVGEFFYLLEDEGQPVLAVWGDPRPHKILRVPAAHVTHFEGSQVQLDITADEALAMVASLSPAEANLDGSEVIDEEGNSFGTVDYLIGGALPQITWNGLHIVLQGDWLVSVDPYAKIVRITTEGGRVLQKMADAGTPEDRPEGSGTDSGPKIHMALPRYFDPDLEY